MTNSDQRRGAAKLGRILKTVADLPAALVRAITVARVIEGRKIPTPHGGKILRAELVQMKDKKHYAQLVLVDG